MPFPAWKFLCLLFAACLVLGWIDRATAAELRPNIVLIVSDDEGWIRTLLEEAENERMHLMTFIHIAKPTLFERLVILGVQWVFYLAFFALYLVSAISRKKRSSATRIIYATWTAAIPPTCRRPPLPVTTGSCRKMRCCATSS